MFVGMNVVKGLAMVLSVLAMFLGMVFDFGYVCGYGLWLPFMPILTYRGIAEV